MKLKKLLTGMAVSALAFGTMFMTALADDPAGTLYVSGASYDATEDQSGEGWSWDAASYTLTLDGFEGYDVKLYSNFDSTVNLVISGVNTVKSESNYDAINLYSDAGEFSVSGSGTLNVTYSSDDSLSFNDGDGNATISDVTLNFSDIDYGFYADGIDLENVTLTVEDAYEGFLVDDLCIKDSIITISNVSYFLDDDNLEIQNSDISVQNVYYFAYSYNFEILNSDISITGDGTCQSSYLFDGWGEYNGSEYVYGTASIKDSTISVDFSAVPEASSIYVSVISDYDTIDIQGSEITLKAADTVDFLGNSDFISNFASVFIADSDITAENWSYLMYAGQQEETTITVTGSEISGSALWPFGIFDTFTVEDSVIDIESAECIYVDTFNIVNSDVRLVGEQVAIAHIKDLNITDSEVYFENVEGIGFRPDSDTQWDGIENYTLNYTKPEYWAIYIDGELSEDYTVESEEIEFGEKIFEIRYIHECSFDDYVSDGESTHTATCECGETHTEDHVWDDGVITKEAEVGVKGEKTYTCTVCGETKTEELDALEAPAEPAPTEPAPTESAPTESADPSQPATGDNGIVLFAAVMLLSAAGFVALKKRA